MVEMRVKTHAFVLFFGFRAKGKKGLIILSAMYGVFPRTMDAFDSINAQVRVCSCDDTLSIHAVVISSSVDYFLRCLDSCPGGWVLSCHTKIDC